MSYFKRTIAYFVVSAALLAAMAVSGCKGRGTGVSQAAGSVDSLEFARGLKISYFNDFTQVTLRDPWDTLKTRKNYILASRELLESRPSLKDSLNKIGILIPTPVRKAVIYTSVHAAMAEQLGLLDLVAGVCEPEYITSSEILRRIDNQEIADLGNSASPNVEKIINLNTDIIIASPFENSGYGAAEKLGIPIVEAADYMENHPLGRTEWVKFYGLIFSCRDKADSLFEATKLNY
ncbi:MAG: ABC transporter substrate-binding protein, partial [Bacteroidales bacterium]|nr:ABC transporter substrate-binding protein [Bacteroidales bacterium]